MSRQNLKKHYFEIQQDLDFAISIRMYLHGISKDAKSIPEASRITTLAILILVARLQRYRRDLIITRVLFLAV